MIKATIQNSPYGARCSGFIPSSPSFFDSSVSEHGKRISVQYAMVIGIEPSELSALEDCEVSLDALNYLGKRMDGMCKAERRQFFAVLSCDKAKVGYGLKNIINLTYNLARFTLIEDTSDLERVGRIHMLNVHGSLSESEYKNSDWLAAEGRKLLDSGIGIDTEYGKLYINEDVPFEEIFNGTSFPAYYSEPDSIAAVELEFFDQTELIQLPCEDIAIRKALCRLGAESISDCTVIVDSIEDISEEWIGNICKVEKTKELFELNSKLKSEGVCLNREPPKSIFYREMSKWLRESKFDFFEKDGCMIVSVDDGAEAKIYNNGTIAALTENVGDEYHDILRAARYIYEYCSLCEKAAPLKADGLSGNYRCLSEFNGTVLAAKYNAEYGFEFVTWDRTYDDKSVCQGKYFEDYAAAKENFATRAGLIDKDKILSTKELEQLEKCVNFTMRHNGDLKFDDCEFLKNISEKISENIPEQQSEAPEMSM